MDDGRHEPDGGAQDGPPGVPVAETPAGDRSTARGPSAAQGAAPVPGLPPTDQLLLALSRLGQAIRLGAWRNAGPHGLTPLQADIVTFLGGDDRPRRQTDVVRALASTAPTVSDAVRALAAKDLLTRGRDADDARAVSLRLTDAGRTEYRRLVQVPVELAEATGVLGAEDRGAVLRSAVAMMGVLQERRAIPVSRMCPTCRFFRPDAHDGELRHHCAFVDAAFADAELRVDCPDHATPD
ncbi:MarR family winged helix-turn-helix transcriptional regulator [Cellulomonas carbonis]|uniref:MarR family transcriptional regulator n=1 Tax=Cellulomonas carbonis T26 TaxID=947969 RepID=A0A0A0BNT1_9CELL|nr:MarR family winged helix-turn-helix transcriptional regulator [Cellulomonas carbonis]KGM09605.1 MarR family transcriptional regulator [Cellulomonas carbonis T26]GGB94905.1 MarR family transcriptional regulator [Cellulomonas carbonis]